jgi:hypothetical protein
MNMPAIFTPTTPVTYVPFDFEGYTNSLNVHFGHYSFFEAWAQFWIRMFLESDEQIKDYIKRFPHSNPVIQRFSQHPSIDLDLYEVFQVEHITDYGTYIFHFDVAAMNRIKEEWNVPIEVIKRSTLHIDPKTPHIEEKLEDERLPYFVRMFGIEKLFICADGNKRVRARMEQGDTEFKGYIFYPEHVERIFFGPQDYYFYMFLYEANLMYGKMMDTANEKKVFSVTQMYLQTNTGK